MARRRSRGSFYYYGDREITFILDGYETKTVIQPIKAPWWDNLFSEFFTENLVPFNLRDEREFKYQLTPASDAAGQRPPRPRRTAPQRGANSAQTAAGRHPGLARLH